MPARLGIVPLLLVLTSACGGARQPSEPPRLVGVIDLRIGADSDTAQEYVFGVIDGLVFDERGRIVVADAKDHTVRVFTDGGRYLYTVGREGQGPGDLSGPCCLNVLSGGLLWIKENGNHRYSVFRLGESEAKFLRSVRGSASYVVSSDRVDFDPEGRLVDLGLTTLAASSAYHIERLRLDSSGVVVARDIAPQPPSDSLSSVSFPAGGGFATYSQPYGARELHAFGAGGESAHGVSSNYAILWTDSKGRTRALAHWEMGDGPALSDAERATTDSMLNSIALSSGLPRSELPLKVPERKSRLEAIGFDLDGRLWIERAVADQSPGETDLYARDGTWIATYQWPTNVTMRFWAVRGELGLGVEEGVDGAQRVVRLRFK